MSTEDNPPKLLPHHEQKELCATRLPYRQGRKLTAVKVYTINNESKHLLIFGVPSLNLRQETKALFMKFGKLLQFNITNYPSERFTETYHAVYESIQSARVAKKMLDTKNYYGGSLHICYAPEMETVEDVREKLLLRKKQVGSRLKNLEKEAELSKQKIENKIDEKLNFNVTNLEVENNSIGGQNIEKMNMGTVNTIAFGKRKFKQLKKKAVKKVKTIEQNVQIGSTELHFSDSKGQVSNQIEINSKSAILDIAGPSCTDINKSNNIDIIDFTSTEKEVISNINEALNYNNFGKEIIRKVPYKPVNRIKFNINRKP